MANPTGSNAEAGDLAKTANSHIISVGVNTGEVIVKGDIVTFDANGFALQGTDTENPIITGRGVALEAVTGTGSDGDDKIRIIVSGYVYGVAGAAIKPNAALEVDTTAGRFQTATAMATIESNKWLLAFYEGHQLEEDGAQTDAADGDIIAVRLL